MGRFYKFIGRRTTDIRHLTSCPSPIFSGHVIARAGRALCLYLESFGRVQSVAMKSAGPNCENFVLRVAQDQKYRDR